MSLAFRAVLDPPRDLIAQISDLTPENPFYTDPYLEVMKRLGSRPCALVLEEGSEVTSGCFGFLTEGRMNARLEITSLPVIADHEVFWKGLFDSCRGMGVSILNVNTFASTEPVISQTDRRTFLKKRSEYRLDLTVPDLWEITNRRHHRLIKRARSNGVSLEHASDRPARERHVELANLSLERRRVRGEVVDYRIQMDDVSAFIECGAGEILQAIREGEVLSSLLLARSRTGGYAQSSGTSETGRGLGSSHFLFHEAAKFLRSEGATVFNLGGADEHSIGLQEFKLGLGSVRVELESAEFYTGSQLKRFATRAAALLKGWPSFPIGV